MSKDSIRLHPKHGLNPTMPICFWCGEDKGEIALLGAAYKEEAPMRMLMDYNPCDKCAGWMSQGITVIEVVPAKTVDNPPLGKTGAMSTIAPTGRWSVIKESALDDLLQTEDQIAAARESKKIIMEKQVYEMIGLHIRAGDVQ